MGDKGEDIDTRLEFMSEYILKSLKQKIDKWTKFITGDERHVLFRFFDMPKYEIIVFRMNTAGLLTCATNFPPISRGKMIYFLRNLNDKITQANFRKAVTIGEISGNVLMDLSIMAEEVIGPLLCNPENQKGWPKCVQNDMKRHVNDLRNLMHQLKGEMASQVMLPMPAGVENIYQAEFKLKESDGENVDLYMKTNIEGAIIKWAQQVHDLLKEDSYLAFKRTKFPLPNADIEFYANRLRNLEGIYSQLRDPRVKRMAHYLEDTRSVYLSCFKTMLTNIVAGLLWGNSRYYCNVEKLIPLLREVCNLVVQQCTNSVDPSSIFQGDADEQLIKIRKALGILNHFVDTYEMNRDKVHTFFPPGVMPVRWSFDFDRVFMRFNVYMKRLKMIETILEATVEILKLEKVEFCGLRGKILSTECMKVLEEYTIIYQNLGSINYDPADPEDESFLKDYNKHMTVIEDVDRRLASLFSQGLDECHNLEHFFKFFQIAGDLFHRPIIKKELKPKLTRLLTLMHNNLDAVKEIYDEEMAKLTKGPERPMVDSYLPPVAGMLWWIYKLRRRIQAPMEDFIMFEDPIIDTEYATYMKQKHNEMLGYLNVVEDRQFKQWCTTVPPTCKTHLAKNLIYRDPPFVRNNFSPELVLLLREIRYMKYLDKQGIPPDGLELYARNEKLQYDMNRLNRAIAWYNAIREGSHETEVALIEKEISAIDQLLGRGVEELTWNDDFTEWMAEVYTAINTLQERVLTAQNNVKRGLSNIAAWGDIPLHNRKENPDKMELLAVIERHPRFCKRRNKILESHAEFQGVLVQNYKLFFNIQEEEDSDDEGEELEEVDEATLDDDEKAARAAKMTEIMAAKEEKRLAKEEKDREKAEIAQVKFERREARRLKREANEAERAERQARRDAGEEVDSPAEEVEEITDPEELADIEAERIEMEEENFRAERWPAYVRYVDSLVSKQVMKAIQSSLDLFERQTDLEKGPRVAFMEITAELRDPDIFFSPSLDVDDDGGLYDTVREMMKDMFLQATLFPRIDPIVPLVSYEDDISDEEAMIDLYHEILKRVENSINDVVSYASKYEKFTYLWMEDRQEVLSGFLKYGRIISPEEFDKYRYENGVDPPEAKPTLEQYQKEIDKYNAMYDEVAALPSDYLCNGWLKLDLKRLNQAIMNIICKWSNLFKQNLKDHVQSSLDDLEKFIAYATKELSVELADDDYEGLLKVMGVLNEVKAKQDAGTDTMFEPLRDIIDVLKEYGVDFPEETYEQLDVLPERWRNLVKLATVMKNNIAPLQAAQAALIAKRVALINLRLTMYRDQFKLKEIFLENCKEPYRQIDKVHLELLSFEEIVGGLKKSCGLFDIQPPDEKNLKQCRRELKLVKQLWDYYSLVMDTIEFWKKSPWKKIDADGMDQECKKFTKDLRQLDKDMRVWEPYLAIEGTIKNLMTSLKAVTDLQNPAIKDRHWIELMMATKNQVQNMMSSKFIGFYEAEVTAWQKKLGTADAWQYLESIFVGSDDIRSQLPEDSKRFDNIDKTFKELLKDIAATPNVVQATNKPGLLDKLEELMKALNLCEKALNDYLETKRLAYPRFYFVSSADLLDILSNGNNPPAVCRHLTKLYDNLCKLVFPKPGSKQAYEMISKENDEHVPFKAPCCDCSGKVEIWLNRVTDCMRYTLRDIFEHSVKSYENKSRDEWVFDWPAQPALVGTQIWWTTETNQAFEKLEEGYENALKDYQKKQIAQLNALIVLLLGDLTVGDRQKIMTICTIDVHSRDVVAKLIAAKVETSNAFQWQSQLRHRWDNNLNNCYANICDAQFLYDYEYLGNTPRLVITPLTDRCYITLTQSLHLIMGGAPAGPAGTGKTETTKDLGRALGIMVYVFNCSEQMDYKSCGNIYKGLAQTGAWGCFDEFNRISVEVLSVVSVQVKTVLDAIKTKKKKFDFMGEYITLIPTIGMFITMNPGYAGRTELPENLKALFRPCAMVVPDFELICEIMLVAEGFQEARLLAQLLSKQDHYDWGLRAIKSVLVVAGSLKVLTLASNERIALTKAMRLLFEISNLRTATPATVSRAGILYINPQDLGWNPFVASWIDTTRDDESEKAMLTVMFDKYIPSLLESCKKYKRITPLTELQQIQLTCYLLECFLNKSLLPSDCPKEWYETYFVFSIVWGFGSGLFQDQLVDWRNEFSKWFCNEFKQIKFPSTGNVFSFFIDPETKKMLPWSEKVESFELDPDLPLQSCLVSTSETTRIRFFMDLLIAKQKPVMLVGSAGSGKTVSVAAKLNSLPDSYAITNVPFNFYTTSEMMQKVLEKPLEKKSGRNFGPPGSKFMIYFVDDLNMPEVDTYGTVQPHTMIRQFMDYKHWYDRQKLSLKDISNCMFVACMNPTAGSFTIDPRLQRHFCTFAVSFPGLDACFHIYKQILSQHLSNPLNKFGLVVARYAEPLVNAALALHNKLASMFLPTAIKFHYIFNLRDLSNIFQGILFTTGDAIKTQSELIRLWMHEATRVYSDKLVDSVDNESFSKLISDVIKKNCEDFDESVVFEKPLIYCHFSEGVGDPKYFPIRDWPQVRKLLEESLSAYNDLVATMNLVLFDDAMYHICRINRILEAPRGNALLVGVGGSGKQSLSRLSAFISSLEVFQIQLRKGYSINDLKVDLALLYIKAGLKNIGNVFLMTDAQVADEKFLVLINDLLASGEIPELLADDEIENIINGVRGETKASGVPDTRENCWRFFINRVRTMLKVVLCFSPVGATLRIRARKFPSIVNCTAINWFHEWPKEALRSVSKRFLSEVESLPPLLVDSVSEFMSHVHQSVNQMSATYFQNERRYNYTTPKTFLEQIALYSKLLNEKTRNLKMMISRLENGLEKLASCAADVAVLKVTLAEQEIILKEKNKAAESLIEVVGAESDKVSKEKAFAAEEEKKVKVIEEDVTIKAKICADDLAKAEPALLAAQEALNTLNKNNLTELKSFGSPPDAVVNVTAAVLVLFSKKGKIPKDRSWKACKLMMAKVDQFLYDLVYYDKENIHPDVIKAVQPYIKNPEFNAEFIMSKSAAAAGLCAWVINICKFYDVYVVVEPKRRALNAANAELQAARDKLAFLTDQIKELEEKLEILLKAFQEAVNEKMKCQAEADRNKILHLNLESVIFI
ncbi:hypothetical protein K1T71_010877 [Dendrolimus kikuchii]|uniref:Uncharacterized protein n=1 Tax=Dendrolimus kikuchii TaxID=765133 RepID=A0ACC1CQA5_9NEOP|nr:hypothetical protein K1T71_010877 [Dendrolimus kikuchii]